MHPTIKADHYGKPLYVQTLRSTMKFPTVHLVTCRMKTYGHLLYFSEDLNLAFVEFLESHQNLPILVI